MFIAAILALLAVAIVFWFINSRFPLAGNVKTVINIVLALIVVGVALWLINTYIPMAKSIKTILNIVVVIATCIGVLKAFGLWSGITSLWNDLIHRRHFSRPEHEEAEERFESPHLH